MPTTAGTGSEATHFSVVYLDEKNTQLPVKNYYRIHNRRYFVGSKNAKLSKSMHII